MAQNYIEPKIEYIKNSRNKDTILIDSQHIFTFSRTQSNKSKLYRCSFYKKMQNVGLL